MIFQSWRLAMKAATRQKFTTEFREQAVKLITEQGLKISEAARRLDISDKSLSRWVIAARERQLDKVDAKRIIPAIEAQIRGQAPDYRRRIRQEQALPLLQDFEQWLRTRLLTLSTQSDTTKAINYLLNQWRALLY
jgi:transposase-like protein